MLLSLLLLLLLAACRCSAAAALIRAERGEDRYQRTRTETAAVRGRGQRSHQGPDSSHRDPQHKDKFIVHLTGPLTFDPKCRKQFQRLYHGTRDCTEPAYYRRCARLLIQLARSPRCAEP